MDYYNAQGYFYTVIFLLGIFFLVYYFAKKDYVKQKSKKYQKLSKLNENSVIPLLNENLSFNKEYNSKSTLDRADLTNIALFYIEENQYLITSLIKQYDDNNRIYQDYLRKFNDILTDDSQDEQLNHFYFRKYESFKIYEYKLCNKLKIKNNNNLTLQVYAHYISPKGQNHWQKSYSFSTQDIKQLLVIINNREKYKKTVKYQRDIMTDSLRYKILRRDNFKCQICGASAKNDGVKLEVDHIVPVSKGGKTEENNLQTLCERCNRGKSNKY